MEFIKNWVLTVVLSAVTGAVILLLCPTGNMERTVKTIVSLFLILSFIVPVSKGYIPELKIDEKLYRPETELSEESERVLTELTVQEIKKRTEQILNNNSVAYDDLKVVVTAEADSIVLEKIIVYHPTADENVIKSLLAEKLGYEIRIEVIDD